MKVLITSGGTKVQIDKVRDITNQSNGTFGSRIAKTFLDNDWKTIFLRAKDSKSPYSLNLDFYENEQISFFKQRVNDLFDFVNKTRHLYSEYGFRNYSDYASKLESVIKLEEPNVVILSAAVSDYGVVNYLDGKIRSEANLNIRLESVPKLISKIKEWHPSTFLVGFKMLVGSSKKELVEEANKSIEKNGCDFVVANDWESFLSGVPEMHIVCKNQEPLSYNKNNAVLEQVIFDKVKEML